MTYRIDVLHFASQRVPGPQVFFQAGWGEWLDFNFYCFLLVGEDRRILVDCGVDNIDPFNEHLLQPALGPTGLVHHAQPGVGVEGLLRKRGLGPDDIDAILLSHLHFDHVSNLQLFPRAQFYLSKEGWERHLALRTSYPQMVPDPVFPAHAVDFIRGLPPERLVLVDDGRTPLPGVDVRYVGGHTADSAAWVVPTEEGRVVLPGDTIWTYRNLEEDHPVGAAVDILQCYRAMEWARTAGDIVIPSHDPEVLRRHPGGIGAPLGAR